MSKRAYISAISHWVPEKVLTNEHLEKMVETTDEWIRTRTGISERRILEDGKASSDMGAEAVKLLLKYRNIDAEEIDGLKIGVRPAPGGKCERCWTISTTVGKDGGHPAICSRCSEVVHSLNV